MFIDSDRSDILKALDLAFLHARRGSTSESESIVREVRSKFPIQEFPLATTKAIFVEGVNAGYRCDWSTAIDKFVRARLLSRAQQDRGLELMVLAWMAFVEFNLNKSREAADLSIEVLRNRGAVDAHTLCRAAIVLAALYQMVDNRQHAERWFQFAKRSSEQLEETALTSVIIFDSAVIRVSVERFNRYLGIGASRDLDLELLFVRSAINFDSAGKVDILSPFHNLLHGQVLNLRGEYTDALTVLKPIVDLETELSPMIRAQAILEYLWCRSNLETENVTREELDAESKCLDLLSDDDDQAIGCWMFARMYEELGESSRVDALDGKSQYSCARFLEWRKTFAEELGSIAADL